MKKSVVKFPSDRVRGGALPLNAIFAALNTVTGGVASLISGPASERTLCDSAGLLVLSIAVIDLDELVVSLRTWDFAKKAYDESWRCYVRTTDTGIRDIRGPNCRPAKLELRRNLFETLKEVVENLADLVVIERDPDRVIVERAAA